MKARARAVARWRPSGLEGQERVLIRSDGTFDGQEFARLLKLRNNRPVTLLE